VQLAFGSHPAPVHVHEAIRPVHNLRAARSEVCFIETQVAWHVRLRRPSAPVAALRARPQPATATCTGWLLCTLLETEAVRGSNTAWQHWRDASRRGEARRGEARRGAVRRGGASRRGEARRTTSGTWSRKTMCLRALGHQAYTRRKQPARTISWTGYTCPRRTGVSVTCAYHNLACGVANLAIVGKDSHCWRHSSLMRDGEHGLFRAISWTVHYDHGLVPRRIFELSDVFPVGETVSSSDHVQSMFKVSQYLITHVSQLYA
jgi:hypothetical protein